GKTTRQLERPNDKIWEAIAQAYNSQRSQQVTSQTLETWLLNSATYARKYLYPSSDSLNNPSGNESSEWLDNLSNEESVLTQLIAQEEEQTRISQQAEINTLLLRAIAQLESPAQQMLELWYRQKLTQQQIALQLEIQQYNVSRRFTKIRETLIKALASWSQEELHIPLTPDILKGISTVIDEWLQVYYSSGC
nr:sigma-70 family RNA polymerase sigma factor [Nostocaceae cyanobacterium]